MKIWIISLLVTSSINLFAQDEVAGHYRNHFFSDIQLNANGTFEYNWYHHFYGSWTKGTWWLKGDTVYFHVVPMYDTQSIAKNNGIPEDSLILSKYSNPRRITTQQLSEVTFQSNQVKLPDKLVFNKKNLYEIKDGRLVTERRIVMTRGSEADPWYFKIDD
jgi:hypothetical protein